MAMPAAFVALNRFGLGARPGDAAAIGDDPKAWVMQQLARGTCDPVAGVSSTQVRFRQVDIFFKAKAEADKAEAAALEAIARGDKTAPPPPVLHPDGIDHPKTPLDMPPGRFLENDCSRRAEQMVASDTPVIERLAAFWSNHFSVTNLRGEIAVTAVPYENEAIRPHLFGTFGDMLFATATHPAMLLYLDAATSVGPDSPDGRAHHQSVNENFGREVMELHTLGVDGGYTQADVQQLALALTGLGLDRADGESAWFYARHEPGERTLLGHRLPDDHDQLRAALRILAPHPATIRHHPPHLPQAGCPFLRRHASACRRCAHDRGLARLRRSTPPWQAPHRPGRPARSNTAPRRILSLPPPARWEFAATAASSSKNSAFWVKRRSRRLSPPAGRTCPPPGSTLPALWPASPPPSAWPPARRRTPTLLPFSPR
jgi:uncharacterized protein (DUF1800 family)